MLDKRLVFVSGKGGVGKSTVSAGLALLAQRNGLRVLAIEVEASGGLAAHFGTGPFQFTPREVRPGLHVMRMVRSEALLEYLSLQLRIPGMGRFGPIARAFDALATAAPAVREIVTIGKILWEVREDRWDLVVVDAPPTGQIGSYLRAPKSITELVTTGRIRSQSDWMAATLADSGATQVLLVTLPEELPTTETLQSLRWFEQSKVTAPPKIITNRVLERLSEGRPPAGPVADMAELHEKLWTEQQTWIEKLPPDLTIPLLFGVFTPGEIAAHISDDLEALK
jgi:anion-transporting  ArsA/GET3 family ATPase